MSYRPAPVHYLFSLALGLVATALLLTAYADGQAEQPAKPLPQGMSAGNGLPQVIAAPPRPDNPNLAGEALPTDDPDVWERLDRELLTNAYWHSNTVLCIKNAHKYFPVIEPILAKNGVPDDMKYLAVAESALRNAVSPAGAKGIWQFMKSTAESYGLEVNEEVDERYHLEKSTEAACRYLKTHKAELGSWTLAAAAYNMGVGGLKRDLREQKESDYYGLNLNSETARYVFRIVALKEILSRPRDFGFYIEDDLMYAPLRYAEVEVNGPVESWADFAHQYGISYRTLKVYNPWLVDSRLRNPQGRSYLVKIPKR